MFSSFSLRENLDQISYSLPDDVRQRSSCRPPDSEWLDPYTGEQLRANNQGQGQAQAPCDCRPLTPNETQEIINKHCEYSEEYGDITPDCLAKITQILQNTSDPKRQQLIAQYLPNRSKPESTSTLDDKAYGYGNINNSRNRYPSRQNTRDPRNSSRDSQNRSRYTGDNSQTNSRLVNKPFDDSIKFVGHLVDENGPQLVSQTKNIFNQNVAAPKANPGVDDRNGLLGYSTSQSQPLPLFPTTSGADRILPTSTSTSSMAPRDDSVSQLTSNIRLFQKGKGYGNPNQIIEIKSFNAGQSTPNFTQLNIYDYPNYILPLKNTNANGNGNVNVNSRPKAANGNKKTSETTSISISKTNELKPTINANLNQVNQPVQNATATTTATPTQNQKLTMTTTTTTPTPAPVTATVTAPPLSKTSFPGRLSGDIVVANDNLRFSFIPETV